MLKIQSDRVIIDGHEPTKEQCETMTLLANALAKSESFKTVRYESGYAEFEKVGKADELKFAPGGGKNLSINFDEGIEKVVYLYNYIELTDNATLPGNAIFYEYTVSDSSQQVAISDGAADKATCGIAIYFKNGYALNTLNAEYLGPYTGIKKNDGTALDAPVYGFTNSVNNSLTAITITSKQTTPRKSVDLTTLPGWSSLSDGSHSITIVAKADGYRDSEPSAAVSVEKAAVMPVKGDIITIESKQYRVLKTDGNIAEVLAMYNSATSQKFDASGNSNVYANSSLDVYLSQTFYDSLSTTMQNAIVAKTFQQDSWTWNGGTSAIANYAGTYQTTNNYTLSLMSTTFGTSISRKCYALSCQDVIDYLEVTTSMGSADTTLTSENVWRMFWNQTTSPESTYLWLRSADSGNSNIAFSVRGDFGRLYGSYVGNANAVRPAFQIDLSKILWSK